MGRGCRFFIVSWLPWSLRIGGNEMLLIVGGIRLLAPALTLTVLTSHIAWLEVTLVFA